MYKIFNPLIGTYIDGGSDIETAKKTRTDLINSHISDFVANETLKKTTDIALGRVVSDFLNTEVDYAYSVIDCSRNIEIGSVFCGTKDNVTYSVRVMNNEIEEIRIFNFNYEDRIYPLIVIDKIDKKPTHYFKFNVDKKTMERYSFKSNEIDLIINFDSVPEKYSKIIPYGKILSWYLIDSNLFVEYIKPPNVSDEEFNCIKNSLIDKCRLLIKDQYLVSFVTSNEIGDIWEAVVMDGE